MTVRQEINLYQPVSSEGSALFSAITAAVTAAAVLACLLMLWGYGEWQVVHLRRNVEALELQQGRQEEATATIGAMHAARANPEQIEARVKQLSAEVSLRTRALALLHSGAAGRTSGFAPRLAALARHRMEGLWIDHIVLSATTGTASLGGGTLDPDFVPRFLHGLAAEAALSGTRFDEFVIEHPQDAAAEQGDKPGNVKHAARGITFRAESNSAVAATAENKS